MGLPPSSAGGVKLTVIWALPAVTVGVSGAPGTVEGVAGAVAGEGGLSPSLLVAVTVQV
jgi:hypothetical protein